jgi:hypothetical protein
MDTAIQGFVSAMLAVIALVVIFHREHWAKPFLNLKSSGADPSTSHASCVAALDNLVSARSQDGTS